MWQPSIEQVYQGHFPNSICSLCVSASHFGNSWNISNFFIIIISVVVINDQGSLMLQLQKDYYSLKAQMVPSIFNKKVFMYVFLMEIWLRYSTALVSTKQQSESAINWPKSPPKKAFFNEDVYIDLKKKHCTLNRLSA